MEETGEYNRVKMSHKRTSRAGFTLFVLGLVVFIIGMGEYLLASYLEVLDKSQTSCSLIVGLMALLTGLLGILAARSRLRLYVLMIMYGIMDALTIMLLFLLIAMEIHRLSSQQQAQQKYWLTLASQLNFTDKIDYWNELSGASLTTRTNLEALSEACYNNSRTIENELYYQTITLDDVSPTENCFGWSYFESAFILAIIQIVLAVVGLVLSSYILNTVIKLNPLRMLKELQRESTEAELTQSPTPDKNIDNNEQASN